ncbi:hypothetical protein ACFFIF_07840 [Vagococcus entomophilus]|uniref:Uncharacterized protein n=1 Tax=Vagococcus entomophilus TaxID=1160095 RepID=A0A430AHD4_9ENTE|nr:hypothetical protein [Vagococcus entomophilus]RSU07321.1 hypothetical protein CBF30_08705 [Vagococcus entomophilus]
MDLASINRQLTHMERQFSEGVEGITESMIHLLKKEQKFLKRQQEKYLLKEQLDRRIEQHVDEMKPKFKKVTQAIESGNYSFGSSMRKLENGFDSKAGKLVQYYGDQETVYYNSLEVEADFIQTTCRQ